MSGRLRHRCQAFAALVAFGAIQAKSTTLIVVRTPVDISLAADSLGTMRGPNGTKSTKPVCKVYRSADTYLGVAGLDNDPTTGFSVANVVFQAANRKYRLRDKMSAAAKVLSVRLLAEANSLRSNEPDAFFDLIDSEKGGVSIILIGIEDGVPAGTGQKFTVSLSKEKKSVQVAGSKVKQCPGSDCPRGLYVFKLGSTGQIDKFLEMRRNITDSSEFARQLVQLEIDAHSAGVGGPIDLLRVTATSQDWINQKAGCPITVRMDEPAPKGQQSR